jgi:hypothetical protein
MVYCTVWYEASPHGRAMDASDWCSARPMGYLLPQRQVLVQHRAPSDLEHIKQWVARKLAKGPRFPPGRTRIELGASMGGRYGSQENDQEVGEAGARLAATQGTFQAYGGPQDPSINHKGMTLHICKQLMSTSRSTTL